MELQVLLFHSRVTAVLALLVFILRNSFCSICEVASHKAENPCDQGGIDLSVEKINAARSLAIVNTSTFLCTLTPRYASIAEPSSDIGEVLKELNATQCFSKSAQQPLQLGLNFSWIMNITDEHMSELTLTVNHVDIPQFYHTLVINLSQHLNIGEVTKFSTKCIPFEGVTNGRRFAIYAKVSNGGYLIGPRVNVAIDCNEIYIQENSFCPVMPAQRPEATPYCNKTVSVTFTPEPPLTIKNTSRTDYSVEICLYGEGNSLCKLQTLQATIGKPHAPRVYFHNVPAGTYNARFAFLDDGGWPCEDHYYRAINNFIVEDPPKVELQINGQPCDKLVVNVTTPKVPDKTSVYKRGQLCLYQNKTEKKCIAMTTEFESFQTKEFSGVTQGSYHVQFDYRDGDHHPCMGNTVFRSAEYTLEDPPEVELHIDSQSCEKLIVSLTTPKVPDEESVYKRGELCLYQSNTADRIECVTVTTVSKYPWTKAFSEVEPGTYHVEFYYSGASGHSCMNGKVRSGNYTLQVTDCHTQMYRLHPLVVGFTTPTVVLVCVACTVILLVLFKRRRHEKPSSQPDDFDSVSGVIIVGAECHQPVAHRVDEAGSNGRGALDNPYIMKIQRSNYPYPDSGLPPSIDELPSIHDGQSRIISI